LAQPDVLTGHISGLDELKAHGIERAAAQCWRSTASGPTQAADVTLPRLRTALIA
jgi:hypothetical protein